MYLNLVCFSSIKSDTNPIRSDSDRICTPLIDRPLCRDPDWHPPGSRFTGLTFFHVITLNPARPVNSISIYGMLTPSHLAGQNVKPKWPSMEGNFVRQFQSSSRSCTSIPALYTASVMRFCLVPLENIPNLGKSTHFHRLRAEGFSWRYSQTRRLHT